MKIFLIKSKLKVENYIKINCIKIPDIWIKLVFHQKVRPWQWNFHRTPWGANLKKMMTIIVKVWHFSSESLGLILGSFEDDAEIGVDYSHYDQKCVMIIVIVIKSEVDDDKTRLTGRERDHLRDKCSDFSHRLLPCQSTGSILCWLSSELAISNECKAVMFLGMH